MKCPPLRLPRGTSAEQLSSLDGERLELCAPLTPSQNERDRWQRMEPWRVSRLRESTYLVLLAQARTALGQGIQKPWAQRARVSIVRCSEGTRKADRANVRGGAKEAIDCLHRIGLLPDDADVYVEEGEAEDRPRGHWGDRPGPGTWLIVERLER